MMENKLRALWLSISLLALTLGLLLGTLLADADTRINARALAEYHRGAYDTCQIFAAQYFPPDIVPLACLDAVRTIIGADWYGQPSAGWVWPPE